MFGNDEKQMEHLIKSHQWEKARKKMESGNSKVKAALAAACVGSTDEEASNLLIELIRDKDENVQLQAVKSLGETGSGNSKTQLQWLSDHLPAEKGALKDEIQKAIHKISERN